MNTPDTVHARRATILDAASKELLHARVRRARRARVATASVMIALGAVVFSMLPPSAARIATPPRTSPDRSIDFAVVRARAATSRRAIDFAIVRDTQLTTSLVTLTDDEAETALAESGYCIKIFRVRNQPVLVDCSTGALAHIP